MNDYNIIIIVYYTMYLFSLNVMYITFVVFYYIHCDPC